MLRSGEGGGGGNWINNVEVHICRNLANLFFFLVKLKQNISFFINQSNTSNKFWSQLFEQFKQKYLYNHLSNSTNDNCTRHLGNTKTLLNFIGHRKIRCFNPLPSVPYADQNKKKRGKECKESVSLLIFIKICRDLWKSILRFLPASRTPR